MSIIDLFKASRASRFETELKPYIEPLYRQAYRLTSSPELAEDLLQELLTNLYEKQISIKKLDNPYTWLLRSLYNQFIDFHRRQQRNPLHLIDEDPLDPDMLGDFAAPHNDSLGECHLTQRALLNALDRLKPEQRILITLHDMEGFSLVELENMLDTPLGTLKSRLHRTRRQLREVLSRKVEPFPSSQRVNSRGE